MPTPPRDPVEAIPPPETVEMMLRDSIRRADLLRALLRVARRKEAHDRPPSADPAARLAPAPARSR